MTELVQISAQSISGILSSCCNGPVYWQYFGGGSLRHCWCFKCGNTLDGLQDFTRDQGEDMIARRRHLEVKKDIMRNVG